MYIKAIKKGTEPISAFCDPAGTRTQGPNIKSVVLYQLSYEIYLPVLGVQKYGRSPFSPKHFYFKKDAGKLSY